MTIRSSLTVRIKTTSSAAVCYFSPPEKIENSSGRSAAAVFIASVNSKFPIGNWELDLRDGEVRMKTSMPLADEARSVRGMLRYVFTTGLELYEATFPALWDVASLRAADPVAAAAGLSDTIERIGAL